MKRIPILFFFILIISCKSHEDKMKTKANRDYAIYHRHIRNKNFSKAVKFINPELFIFIPKETIVDDLDALYNVKNVEYKLYAPKNIKSTNYTVFNDKKFVYLSSEFSVNVRFTEFTSAKQGSMDMLKSTLRESLNAKKIDYNPKTNVFHVEIEENLYGIYNEGWKFMVLNKKNKEFVEKIIPEEVIIELEGLYNK